MLNYFRSIGISYKEAALDLRSKISFTSSQSNELLLHLRDSLNIQEIVIISTCNRTELFYTSHEDLSEKIFNSLFAFRGLTAPKNFLAQFIVLSDYDAVERLFNISIGLESKVLGDLQIITQMKKAYQQSTDLNLVGPFLHRLMHSIFFTNKKVVQETSFRDGAASVSYASYELIEELSASLVDSRILVLGLGEMGRDISLHLKDHGFENVTLMNRTFSKAKELSEELSFKVERLEELPSILNEVDIVVSSVTTQEPIITKKMIAASKPFALKYMLDISVPASIDKDVETVSGVLLHSIDDIQSKTNDTLLKRELAIPNVRSIIKESLLEFKKWSQELNVSPTINKLKEALEQIRKEEISKYFNKMDQNQVDMVDMVTKSMVQKIIKLPVLELKAACKRGEAETLIDVLSGIFNLEEQEKSKLV